MLSQSRRAFLTGRRTPQDAWQAFCQAMRRTIDGTFYEFDRGDGPGSARLTPKQASDVHKARALCGEHGVLFALDDVARAARQDELPVLWVDPGRSLGLCQRLEPDGPLWFVQPGCLLGELEAAGMTAFAELPCHITVASWLADRCLCDWPAGETFRSGVVQASVLLDDGVVVNLGPFGERNRKPLDGARLQRLIPALFQLSAESAARDCRGEVAWPARYRLDALSPAAGHTVNLAHLILGHGGDLGWLEWVVIDERLAMPLAERPYEQRFSVSRADDAGLAAQAGELDMRMKALFDPESRFPHPGQDL
ncbi:hypothetical protein ERD78_17725 [Allopusillimonas soli]|uniref:hypothetical protein n=1 Tax=Allopusillimonas soli TaxID=659016 RepID=UPI0010202B8E|nr:hypothetical protein [Allopusillimonas soli]TEA71786.1 hypothetical protein ERD78_17725 [Allopusillimonas soli]